MTEVTGRATLVDTFREGLKRGELLLQQCRNCGRVIMYPRHRCPFCHSDDLDWEASAGAGTLHSYTVVRAVPPRGFEADLPYALGIVKLDEGAQLLVRLRPSNDGDWANYVCDVRVRFDPAPAEEIERRPAPWFTLADPARTS
jgi:uncharacterized OB-fold protein